jgi:hypothetical protein
MATALTARRTMKGSFSREYMVLSFRGYGYSVLTAPGA